MAYKVPFVDVPKQFRRLRDPIMATIEQVLSRGNLILRDELREFEESFASLVGRKYAVGVNSGTDALHLSLRAIGFQEGDEIITVSHTCVATVAAIIHAGAKPLLVDVGEDFNMDMDQVEAAITPRTRAIIPVHLNGRSCDMDRLMAISQRHGLIVIEDAAQGLGARFGGRPVGSFGLIGCFSLYPFKMLGAYGDAGIVATDEPEIARKISQLRSLGEDRETGELLCFGFHARLDNLQAAILSVKLKYLPEWIERRREIAHMYTRGLSELPFLKLPDFPGSEYFDAFLNYCVRIPERDRLTAYLREQSVEPLTPLSLAKPIHHHQALGLPNFALPRTERIAREFVYIPIYPELEQEQVNYVIECIKNFSPDHELPDQTLHRSRPVTTLG